MAIQRFTWTYDEITPDKNGRWVAHDDHLAALREQRNEILNKMLELEGGDTSWRVRWERLIIAIRDYGVKGDVDGEVPSPQ